MEILVLVMFQKKIMTVIKSKVNYCAALRSVVKVIVYMSPGELFLWIIIWDFGMFGACQQYLLKISAIELRKV